MFGFIYFYHSVPVFDGFQPSILLTKCAFLTLSYIYLILMNIHTHTHVHLGVYSLKCVAITPFFLEKMKLNSWPTFSNCVVLPINMTRRH